VTPAVGPSAPGREPGEAGEVEAAVPPAAGAPVRGRARDFPTAFRSLDVEARAPPAAGVPAVAVSIVPRPAQTLDVGPKSTGKLFGTCLSAGSGD
jgi:hypothetical protein